MARSRQILISVSQVCAYIQNRPSATPRKQTTSRFDALRLIKMSCRSVSGSSGGVEAVLRESNGMHHNAMFSRET
jgi:hypothetical protein